MKNKRGKRGIAKFKNLQLKPCAIYTKDGHSLAGMIYFKNKRFVVLVQTIVEGANLGKMRSKYIKYCEPEATVIVIPRNLIAGLEILK